MTNYHGVRAGASEWEREKEQANGEHMPMAPLLAHESAARGLVGEETKA